ncbi:acylneuraminate cytidylyltransferase family protein [Methanolobus sp. ZRKC5]|uniref:acylneuraminate cytidylyltransferase family protein n=1 Tax=unclassified Methanolobus TaxID=2629569 RepID=UPI00313E7601
MRNDYSITALLPMKGHSERVPSKNTRTFGKDPLFFHILRSLESADQVSQILVDTDSHKIMSLIEENFPDVLILERPDYLLGDKVPMTSIIDHDLKHVKTSHFLQTHATNPLLKSGTIDNAIKSYFEGLKNGFDSVMGVTKYQTRFYDHNKNPVNHDPNIMLPSQDMIPLYEDNSNFYIISIENFMNDKKRVGKNPLFVDIPKIESIDIDEPEDFVIAEAVYNFLTNERKQ